MKPDAQMQPLRWDARSGWEIAPRCAWDAGEGQLVRCFSTAAEAIAFISAAPKNRAADNQREYRRRQRKGVAVVPVPLSPIVVEALLEARRLDEARSLDRKEVAGEVATVLQQWATAWLKENRYR